MESDDKNSIPSSGANRACAVRSSWKSRIWQFLKTQMLLNLLGFLSQHSPQTKSSCKMQTRSQLFNLFFFSLNWSRVLFKLLFHLARNTSALFYTCPNRVSSPGGESEGKTRSLPHRISAHLSSEEKNCIGLLNMKSFLHKRCPPSGSSCCRLYTWTPFHSKLLLLFSDTISIWPLVCWRAIVKLSIDPSRRRWSDKDVPMFRYHQVSRCKSDTNDFIIEEQLLSTLQKCTDKPSLQKSTVAVP